MSQQAMVQVRAKFMVAILAKDMVKVMMGKVMNRCLSISWSQSWSWSLYGRKRKKIAFYSSSPGTK